jgi:GAF domain-containing protein/HAMP domain-containing protein
MPGVLDMTVNSEKSQNQQNLKRVLWAYIPIGTLGAAFFFFMGIQTNTWQLYVMGIAALVPVFAALISFALLRRGQAVISAWLMVIVTLLVLTVGPVLFQGIGTLLGFSALLLGAFLAGETLPRQQVERVVFVSVAVGSVDVLIDLFGPASRLQPPPLFSTILIVLLAIALGLIGFQFFRQFKNYSLRIKLIIGFIVVAITSTAAIGFFVNNVAENEITTQVGTNLNKLAQSQALAIGNGLEKQIELIKALALNKKIETAAAESNAIYKNDAALIRAELAQLDQQWQAADAANNNDAPLVQKVITSDTAAELRKFREAYSDQVEIFITDRYGALLAATNRTSDYNQSDEVWWQAAYNDGNGAIYFGPPIYDESSQKYASIIAVPITASETGRVIGVLRSTYYIITLTQNLTDVRISDTSKTSLVFPNGEMLDASGKRDSLSENALAQIDAIPADGYSKMEYLGALRLVSQATVTSRTMEKDTINTLGWKLVTAQDPEEALRPVAVISRTTQFIGLLTLLAVSGLATIAGQFLANPIVRLTKITEQVRAGDLSTRAKVESQDEIGTLAETFNTMAEQLDATLQGLEQRVAERTTEMELRSMELADRTVALELANIRTQKRAEQLQAISDVSRTVAAIRNVTELLPRITKVISERFGFYHVGIFLLDEANQYAILGAANSEGGERMLARGHRLKVGAQGIVGYVTGTGNPRIAMDTGTDTTYFNNPDLPNTHSEMAVPLKSGNEIIGALDVQSERANAFTPEDIDVIQTLAAQVSIAIENARLFDATQKSLSESETIYRQYVRREWKRLAANEKMLGFRYTITGATPLKHLLETPTSKQAAQTGQTHSEISAQTDQAALSVPIKLRDEVIGMLNIRSPRKHPWSQDEIRLVQAVADRVAVSAENARLFDETTQRAERERTVSEITSKIRSTNDPQEMIQIAITELKQALQIKEARVVPYHPPTPNGERKE